MAATAILGADGASYWAYDAAHVNPGVGYMGGNAVFIGAVANHFADGGACLVLDVVFTASTSDTVAAEAYTDDWVVDWWGGVAALKNPGINPAFNVRDFQGLNEFTDTETGPEPGAGSHRVAMLLSSEALAIALDGTTQLSAASPQPQSGFTRLGFAVNHNAIVENASVFTGITLADLPALSAP